MLCGCSRCSPPAPQTRREVAGQSIAPGRIKPSHGGWQVPSESGDGVYLVHLNDEDRRAQGDETPWSRRPQCTCPDNRVRHTRCKHIVAVFRKLAQHEITIGTAVVEQEAAWEWLR